MLELIDVKKNYLTAGSQVEALKGVSLCFRKNEFVSILGASGCGKTTLLNIIGGLDHYTSGDLIVSGVSTKNFKDRDWDVYRNHRIGFIFQSYNLIPHQTVLENVELALTIAGISRAERKKRASDALEKVGLKEQQNKKPNQLSGGQMQRVAIARALVNNPEILLADEPTGALDSTTSVQIMELIKEISGDRLVIMVTHNPDLAEKYSSRLIRLSDGEVISDSDPFNGLDETEEDQEEKIEKCANKKVVKERKKKKEKAAMSYFTSLGLSAKNLLSKKGRTAITSVAGSIGIISVCLVLALSNGFNKYILKTEEDMLSYYPMTVSEQSIDMTSMMQRFNSTSDMPSLSEIGDKVYVNSFLTKMAQGMTISNNISDAYLSYVDGAKEYCNAVQYSTGVSLSDNLFTSIFSQKGTGTEKVMSLSALKQYYTALLANSKYEHLAYMIDYLGSVGGVMPNTTIDGKNYSDFVLSQYDVVAGTFPENEKETVLVIGGNNDMTDLLLAQLGFIDEQTFLSLFPTDPSGDLSTEIKAIEIPFEDILKEKFVLYYNDSVYESSTGDYPFKYKGTKSSLQATEDEGIELKISGILRLKDNYTYGCLSAGLNFTESLIQKYIQKNITSSISQYMINGEDVVQPISQVTGMNIYRSPAENLNANYGSGTQIGVEYYIGYETSKKNTLRLIGGTDSINNISFYPKNFDEKERLITYLDKWDDMCEKGETYTYTAADGTQKTTDPLTESDKIRYTDTVGVMMSMMQQILNAVTYVLVAFTAISLVVSSVMIGIITYVSVVERTKEIGVLRALGARKKDIKNLFNAETFIIGATSGIFGVAITYLFSLGINGLLGKLTGIASLCSLPFGSAVVMICVSVILTLISGLIPASKAAKKDPVVALRTE